jgi:hypothetical protein
MSLLGGKLPYTFAPFPVHLMSSRKIYAQNTPFSDKHDVSVILAVLQGQRPERPPRVSDELWKIIELCWTQEPRDRPDMKKVLDLMRDVDFGIESMSSPPDTISEP